MVDVKRAASDVVKGPDAGANHVRDAAHDAECNEKADRGQEETLAPLILEMKVIQPGKDLHSTVSRRGVSCGESCARSRPRRWRNRCVARRGCVPGKRGSSARAATCERNRAGRPALWPESNRRPRARHPGGCAHATGSPRRGGQIARAEG